MSPLLLKALAALAVGLALFGWGWRVGAGRVEARWSAQRSADQLAVAGTLQRAAEDGTRALERVIRERDTIASDLKRARDELQDVPPCPIPPAAVRVHDLAAGAVPVQVPEPPIVPNGGPEGSERDPELSALLKTVSENYRICREDQARLSALQGWVRDVAR